MRVGLRLPPCRRADEMAAAAQRAELLGFDAVWFPDSQLLWRDVYAILAVAASRTERVILGTAVTNVATRHPSVLAAATRTIQELAPNRFVLGIGAGDSALRPVGLAPTSGSGIRAKLAAVRRLVSGEAVDFGRGDVRLRDVVGSVPVYVAANGPRNLALAGAVADGVILLEWRVRPGAQSQPRFRTVGRTRGGRRDMPLDVVVSAFTHVTDDVERDARMLKPIIAAIAQTGGTGCWPSPVSTLGFLTGFRRCTPISCTRRAGRRPSRCAVAGSATPTRWRSPKSSACSEARPGSLSESAPSAPPARRRSSSNTSGPTICLRR